MDRRVVGALGIAFALSTLALAWSQGAFHERRAFGAERWRAADTEGRGTMVRDLVRSRALIGLNAEQLRTTLGPPDQSGSGTWIYRVGFMGRCQSLPFCFPYRLIVVFGDSTVAAVSLDD